MIGRRIVGRGSEGAYSELCKRLFSCSTYKGRKGNEDFERDGGRSLKVERIQWSSREASVVVRILGSTIRGKAPSPRLLFLFFFTDFGI